MRSSELQSIIDFNEARRLRNQGQDKVASHNQSFLEVARETAKGICRIKGTVTIEDVRISLGLNNVSPDHPNAWGSVFKGGDFEFTGEYIHSSITSRHAGLVRVWRLK